MEYTRPYLYPKQLSAIFCPERYACVEASTKSGKTVASIAWIVEQAIMGKRGQNYWWVAPGYIQAEIAYRRIKNNLTPGSFSASETPTPRITVISGAVIWFKSGDNPDALYGEDVYGAVVDEASRVREESWVALRSTLTYTNGHVRMIGNVKGRKNWFWDMCRKAEAGAPNMKYSRINADDAVNAGVLDAAEIIDAKDTMSDRMFRELYYNEPGDDTGNPFGLDHIRACVRDGLAPGPVAVWGIDLAKSQDYFVCIGLNDHGGVAAFHRWRGVPWRDSIRRVHALIGEDAPALVDSTGVGDPVLEELQYDHGNFYGYHFSAASKQKLMEGLAVSIQSHEVSFPDGPIRIELDAYEYDEKPSGVRYSGAAGQNDDCVCALALARQMWTESAPGDNMIKYYAMTAEQAQVQRDRAIPSVDNPRPWREDYDANAPTAEELLTNELTKVYEETLAKLTPNQTNVCPCCGTDVVGPERITDGEHIWHRGCSGFAALTYKRAA